MLIKLYLATLKLCVTVFLLMKNVPNGREKKTPTRACPPEKGGEGKRCPAAPGFSVTVGVLRATLARHDWAHKPSEGLHYRASELVVQPAGAGGGQCKR